MTGGAAIASAPRVRSEPLAYVSAGGRAIALNQSRPGWAVVNRSAEWILRYCDVADGRTAEEVTAAYRAEFGPASEDTIEAALAELESARLVHVEGRTGTEDGDVREYACAEYGVEHLYVELLARCNLRCIHCYMSGAPERPELLEGDEVVKLLRDFHALGGRYVTLSGGEPLIYRDFPRVARAAAELDLSTTVITNGTALRQRHAELLADLGCHVTVSLDGASAVTHDRIRGRGSFERTTRGLERVTAALGGERVTLSMSPNKINLHELRPLFELARERGIKRLNLSLIEPVGRGHDHWEELALTEAERKSFVGAVYEAALDFVGEVEVDFNDTRNILDVFAVDRQPGEIHPLWRGVRVDSSGDCYPSTFGSAGSFHLGNVRERSLGEILGSEVLEELDSMLRNRFHRIPRCSSCAWGQLCRGGGVTSSYYATGELFEPDTYCAGYLETFPRVAVAISDLPGDSA